MPSRHNGDDNTVDGFKKKKKRKKERKKTKKQMVNPDFCIQQKYPKGGIKTFSNK